MLFVELAQLIQPVRQNILGSLVSAIARHGYSLFFTLGHKP
jgi:hypothetical protein